MKGTHVYRMAAVALRLLVVAAMGSSVRAQDPKPHNEVLAGTVESSATADADAIRQVLATALAAFQKPECIWKIGDGSITG
jgi:uncharacterized membrane-anchored protein